MNWSAAPTTGARRTGPRTAFWPIMPVPSASYWLTGYIPAMKAVDTSCAGFSAGPSAMRGYSAVGSQLWRCWLTWWSSKWGRFIPSLAQSQRNSRDHRGRGTPLPGDHRRWAPAAGRDLLLRAPGSFRSRGIRLYDTFGFPIDLTEIIAGEHGVEVDLLGLSRSWTSSASDLAMLERSGAGMPRLGQAPAVHVTQARAMAQRQAG